MENNLFASYSILVYRDSNHQPQEEYWHSSADITKLSINIEGLTLKAISSFSSVAAARDELHERMKRSGGGLEAG